MYYNSYGAYDTADERAERQRREDEYAAATGAARYGLDASEALAELHAYHDEQRARQAAFDARMRARYAATTTTREDA